MRQILKQLTGLCALCANDTTRPQFRQASLPWSTRLRSGSHSLLLLLGLLATRFSATALPIAEPFADATALGGSSFTVGSSLAFQTNSPGSRWNALGTNFSSVKPLIDADNLSYPGLPPGTGSSVSFAPSSGQGARLDLNNPTGLNGTYYYSFLLKLTDLSAVPAFATNNPIVAYCDDPSEQGAQVARLGARLVTKRSGAGYLLGVSKSATLSDFVYEPSPHNPGDVVFVVVSYEWFRNVSTNVNLWINPPASSFGAGAAPAPTATVLTGNTAINNNGVRAFAVLCQFPSAPAGVLDELRVGTSWAFVTGGPDFQVQPADQTLNAGATVTFATRVLGGAPLHFQWQKDGVDLVDGGKVLGANTATLSISNVLQADFGGYSLVVTNSYGSVVSSPAFLTVNDPAILTQPASQILPPGANASLQVIAAGTPPLSYQWYKDNVGLSDGGRISGATTNTLRIGNFSFGDAGVYYVQVFSGAGGSVTSSNAQLLTTDPSVATQPQSLTVIYGSNAVFQVLPSGTGPFGYQWRREGAGDLADGGNISGSRTATLTLAGVATPDAGNYWVTVTNALGTADSAVAVLTVRDPAVLTPPLLATNLEGAAVSFRVVAIGTPSLNYQWSKNGTPLFDGGNVSGSSSNTLTLFPISAADAGDYTVLVTGGFGTSEASSAATLTVISGVAITTQPTPRTVAAGSKTVLAVGVSGSAPFGYQWQLGETAIPGATAAAYVLTNVQPSVTGSYRVVVTNAVNAATSSVAAVTIADPLRLYATNAVVIRLGDGAQALGANGNSMFLDQFAPNGAYVNTVGIPDDGPYGMTAIGPSVVSIGGTSTSLTGTCLSRSADERLLVLAGYNTNLSYNAPLQNATALAVPRGIGVIDTYGRYTLPIATTNPAFNATFWRAAVTDGTNNYWGAARSGAAYYFGFDAPAASVQSLFVNVRSMGLFNGSIYCVSAASGAGVMKLDGQPTGPATPTVLFTGSTGSSDLEVSPDGNLIYVADDGGSGAGAGVQRYEFDGTAWNLVYTLSAGLPAGARYLTADFRGAHPIIYAITPGDANNQVVLIEDAGAGSVGTTIALAGANQSFRGIRLGPAAVPVVARPPLVATRDTANNKLLLNWTGGFFLQSAPAVTGPYTDVINGTRPSTNSLGSAGQGYFRLRQ